MTHYLRKEAWENLSPEERETTERKKREGSEKGEQYVENTKAAKKARKEHPGAGPSEATTTCRSRRSRSVLRREAQELYTLLEHLDRNFGDSS